MRLTPFEQGYAAFLAGSPADQNPHDADKSPWYFSKWLSGWKAALKAKQEKMT